MLKIAMLSTGEEVLHGDIDDTNASWFSSLFYEHGYQLSYRATVGDDEAVLERELGDLSKRFDVVIVNGGLGPTSDDLTALAAANAAGKSLVLFGDWLEKMEQKFARRGIKMPESNLKQAMLPEGSVILDNPVGTACGFELQIGKASCYFTPGVPSEFKHMIQSQVLPKLAQEHPDVTVNECSRIYTFGLSESGISDKLERLTLPAGYQLGYRSYLPFIEVKLFGPVDDMTVRMSLLKIIYSHLKDAVVSVDEPMLDNVANLLLESRTSVALAEQSSLGYLSSWLHENEVLAQHLKLGWVMNSSVNTSIADKEPLAAALAMAAACRENGKAHFGLATGALSDGSFAIALSCQQGEWGQVLRFNRDYDRLAQRKIISTLVLDMLRRHLEGKPVFGQYGFVEREKELYVPAASLS